MYHPEDKTIRIAAVVVTFNRKKCLIECLGQIARQTVMPDCVYIIDNASTDGTSKELKENGYLDINHNGCYFKYVRLEKNTGGAGGFHAGFKYAIEEKAYDAIWVMDDDGLPNEKCLEELIRYYPQYDFIAPTVLSTEDHVTSSFFRGKPSYDELKRQSRDGIIKNKACPFNGILFSARLVHNIGYPKKEMFLWGDENNYQLRAEAKGYNPITVISAIHYHPIDRQQYAQMRNGVSFVTTDINWKLYCAIRNKVYNSIRFRKANILKTIASQFHVMMLYIDHYKGQKKTSLIIDATLSGMVGYFGGLTKYMNKKNINNATLRLPNCRLRSLRSNSGLQSQTGGKNMPGN